MSDYQRRSGVANRILRVKQGVNRECFPLFHVPVAYSTICAAVSVLAVPGFGARSLTCLACMHQTMHLSYMQSHLVSRLDGEVERLVPYIGHKVPAWCTSVCRIPHLHASLA